MASSSSRNGGRYILVSWRDPHDLKPNGKPRQKTKNFTDDPKGAEACLALAKKYEKGLIHSMDALVPPKKAAPAVTVKRIMRRFIDDSETTGRLGDPPLEKSSIAQYERFLKHHIAPEIGTLDVAAITVKEAAAFRDKLRSNPAIAKTAPRILIIVKAAIDYAMHPQVAMFPPIANPFQDITIEASSRLADEDEDDVEVDENMIHTVEEFRAICLALLQRRKMQGTLTSNSYTVRQWQRAEIYILLGFLCGLRSSEARGLRRSDIDWTNSTIRIRQRVDQWGNAGALKSSQARRMVPVPPYFLRKIKAYLDAQPSSDPDALLLATRDGKPVPHNLFWRKWDQIQTDAKLTQENRRRMPFHRTRHYYASSLIEKMFSYNVNPKEIATMLGHATFEFTERVYGKIIQRISSGRKLAVLANSLFPDPDWAPPPLLAAEFDERMIFQDIIDQEEDVITAESLEAEAYRRAYAALSPKMKETIDLWKGADGKPGMGKTAVAKALGVELRIVKSRTTYFRQRIDYWRDYLKGRVLPSVEEAMADAA